MYGKKPTFLRSMYLAADIGGTKTHLALYRKEGDSSSLCYEKKYSSQGASSLEEIVEAFQKEKPVPIEKACFAIAGPIVNQTCKATNLPWEIDASNLEKNLKIPKVVLINDLEANAYGLRMLRKAQFYEINKGKAIEGNQALISAGTGLGEAGLYFDGKEHIPFASEGGHTDFAPINEEQVRLFEFLRKKNTHVSDERVLSGMGFLNIYDFFLAEGFQEEKEVERAEESEKAKIVTDLAKSKKSEIAEQVVRLFVQLYAQEAGNVALKYLAVGGVFIGGGIAPKILFALKKESFMQQMSDKGRFESLLRSMPVKVILEENTALLGACYFCKNKMKN